MRRMIKFGALTVALVLIGVFGIAGCVKSAEMSADGKPEQYYLEKEKELVQETREYLKDAGYANSGVMLTRVVDESGNREYTLTVHHSKINALDEVARENLQKDLDTLTFASDECTFCHEFLATE